MAVEPVALILPRGDPQFKRRIDTIVSHQMIDGRVSELYSKWFERPIPPSGTTIGMPMSEVLRGSMAFPVDILGMN
jgi:glutamate/aspartate transport system substrate-binding protein